MRLFLMFRNTFAFVVLGAAIGGAIVAYASSNSTNGVAALQELQRLGRFVMDLANGHLPADVQLTDARLQIPVACAAIGAVLGFLTGMFAKPPKE
jgi:hypothetical protein